MDLRTSLPAVAVTLGCLRGGTTRTAIAPAPPTRRAATEWERLESAQLVKSVRKPVRPVLDADVVPGLASVWW